jgi:hypothetical protein
VLKCQRIEQGVMPISVYSDLASFKLYMSDVGLLTMKIGISQQAVLSAGEIENTLPSIIPFNLQYEYAAFKVEVAPLEAVQLAFAHSCIQVQQKHCTELQRFIIKGGNHALHLFRGAGVRLFLLQFWRAYTFARILRDELQFHGIGQDGGY